MALIAGIINVRVTNLSFANAIFSSIRNFEVLQRKTILEKGLRMKINHVNHEGLKCPTLLVYRVDFQTFFQFTKILFHLISSKNTDKIKTHNKHPSFEEGKILQPNNIEHIH